MNGNLFRAARDYHGAIAAYCRALSNLERFENIESLEHLEKLEHLAQEVLGASLRYRAVLDELMRDARTDSDEARIGRRRLGALRSLLHFTSGRYNAHARPTRPFAQPAER